MRVTQYQLGRALPDQVTPDELQRSRLLLSGVREVDPSSITNSQILAEKLQGVSWAISNLVLSRGTVEIRDLALLPDGTPGKQPDYFAVNVLRRPASPALDPGEIFRALPDTGYGASMSALQTVGQEGRTILDIHVPPDSLIDRVLSTNGPWQFDSVSSKDYRDYPAGYAFPFNGDQFMDGDEQRYFGLLQLMSQELLRLTKI